MVIQELKPSKRVEGRWLAVLEDGSILRLGEGVFMILVTLSSLLLTFKGKLAVIAAGKGDMFAAYLQAGLAAILFILALFLVREALPVLRGEKTKTI